MASSSKKKTDNKLKFKDNAQNLLGHGGGVGMKINESGLKATANKKTDNKLNFKDSPNNLYGHGGGVGMKINDPIAGNKHDGYKPTGGKKRDDSWKDDLRSAYDTMAANQIKASDEAYAQAKSSADRQAQSRGMGRSSYNNATLANLDAKGVEAQNEIRANVDAAYQQAVLNQQNVYDQLDLQQSQLDFQQQQAAQQQANWQAQFGYQQQQDALAQQNWQSQFAYQQQQDQLAQQNWQAQFGYQQQQDQQAQQNWQAQFDAQQAQQAWENEYNQDVFAYQNGIKTNPNASASSSSSSSTTPSSKPSTPPPGGKDEDEIEKAKREKEAAEKARIDGIVKSAKEKLAKLRSDLASATDPYAIKLIKDAIRSLENQLAQYQ